MEKIFGKITLWFVVSIIACAVIYLISSIVHASFDIRDWSFIGRFFTGFIMTVTICIIADEVSDLKL